MNDIYNKPDPRGKVDEEVTDESVDEQIDDLMDTLDLKSNKEESAAAKESEEREESEEEIEEEKEGRPEEKVAGPKDAEESEVAEEERETLEKVEEESESEPEPEPDRIKVLEERNRLLVEELNKASGQEPAASVPEPPAAKPATPITPVPAAAEPPPISILKDLGLDIDDVVSNPELFEKVLNKHAEVVRNQVAEQIFRSIPSLIMKQVQKQTEVNEAVAGFYKQNEDLIPIKNYVGKVANVIAAENPSITLGEVFEKTAIKTREVLGLRVQAKKVVKKRKRNPALRQPARRYDTKSSGMTDLEKDVADTFDL